MTFARPTFARLTFKSRRRLFLILMGVPATAYVAALAGGPVAQGVWYSFFSYNLQRPARRHFVGLDNYAALWADDATRAAIVNTFAFTAAAVGVEFVCGLALALLLWRDSRFNRAATALMLVPTTLTPLVVGLAFRGLLNADFGLLGYYARTWGFSEHGLLAGRWTALPTLVAIDVWEWTPLVALILLAGLKAVPQELIDAAEIDGASGWQRLWVVVLPTMLPAVLLALVLRGMDAFRVFDSVFATTQGGPADATTTLMFQAVKTGLSFFDVGAASAISNFMLVCLAALAAGFALLTRGANRRLYG